MGEIGNNFNGENTTFDILDLFANNGSVSLIEGTTVTAALSQVGSTVTFNLGAEGMVDVTLLGASFTCSGAGATFGTISANFLLPDIPPPAPVPEPAAILLLATPAGPILVRRRFSR